MHKGTQRDAEMYGGVQRFTEGHAEVCGGVQLEMMASQIQSQ